ncbi:MAG: YggT family protein [Janthinobacterium lividum]
MVTLTIVQILQVVLDVVWWIIFVQFVLSILMAFNVINTSNSFIRSLWYALERMTDPIYRPIRRVLPNMGGLDFSPAIVLVLIRIIGIVLNNVAASAAMGGAV